MGRIAWRVLVIEDDLAVSEVIRLARECGATGCPMGASASGQRVIRLARELQDDGYVAQDGAAALDLLDVWRRDLITTDLCMPVMDGWQLVTAYWQRPGPPVPIIACSANGGATAVLGKPFALEQLLQTIEACLSR